MKKLVLLSALLLTVLSFGQVPQGISYQAIALNGSGNPVVSSNVGIRLSILDVSATGSVLYTETHTSTTNAQGLFSLVIGQGTPTTGTFSAIKWETNSKFLKVEMDATGGTTYVLVGTTQLLSVPYALYAESANNVNASDISGFSDSDSSAAGFMTSTDAYYFFNGNNTPNLWLSQPLSGQPIKILGTDGNLGVLTTTNAYVAILDNSGTSAQWYSISLTGTPIKMVSSKGNFGILTTTNAYVFSESRDANNIISYNWYTQALAGTPIDITAVFSSGFGVTTSTNGYAFAKTSTISPESICNWYPSSGLSGTYIKSIVNLNKFTIYTSTNAYTFTPIFTPAGTLSYNWYPITMNGNFINSAK